MYVINEWFERYEVNDKGRPAEKGDTLRKFGLKHIRSKVHGRRMSAGFSRMQSIAGDAAYEVFGIFHKLLEIAGCEIAGKRGTLLNHKGEPATIEDLAFDLRFPVERVSHAMSVLTHPQVEWVKEVADNFRELPESPGQIREPYISRSRNEKKCKTTKRNGNNNPARTHTRTRETPTETDQQVTAETSSTGLLAPSFSTSTRLLETRNDKLDYANKLRQILKPKSNSDFGSLFNFQHWLETQYPHLAEKAMNIAVDCKNGRKPIAVFFSRITDELGYRARAQADKARQ